MNQAAWDLHLENVELRRQLAAAHEQIQQLKRRLVLVERRRVRAELKQKGWR